MLEKKTKRELALDFFLNFMDEGTSKDEAGVWVSQESLIKTLNKFFNHGNKREMTILNAILKDLDNFNKKLNEEEKC